MRTIRVIYQGNGDKGHRSHLPLDFEKVLSGSERSSLFVLHKFSKLCRQSLINFVCCLWNIFYSLLQLTSDTLKYFWKISTCQFKLIGSGNCNHFILSFCWEIKEPNIKHKLLLDSCKNVQFFLLNFFSKLKKFPFCLFNIRHYVKLIDGCFTQELNNY